MTIPDELQDILSIHPEIMGGDICFTGTRIPIWILLDNQRAGISLDDFLDAYPDLRREHVQQVIAWEVNRAEQALGLDQAS